MGWYAFYESVCEKTRMASRIVFVILLVFVLVDVGWNSSQYAAFFTPQEPEANRAQTPEEAYIRSIVREEVQNTPKKTKILSSCKAGFIRGCLAGLITGGADSAITNSVVNAALNPLMLAFNT